MDRDEILRVLKAFEAAGLEYVLIGAAAMGFHGVVRATEDLDVMIKGTAENIERLRAALYFDVLTRFGAAANFETVDSEIKSLEDTHVTVATPAALYRMKKDAVRAKDHQDAAALRQRFGLTDED